MPNRGYFMMFSEEALKKIFKTKKKTLWNNHYVDPIKNYEALNFKFRIILWLK